MVHDAHGWWIEEAGRRRRRARARGDADADVVVDRRRLPRACGRRGRCSSASRRAVVLLEAERCGHGPSGRNGGFVSSLWH